MIDKVRQKAAAEEKKKDDDLKKKEEVSKKIEDEKPENLLVSVVRKVIKEEQSDSNMGVETDNKEGFKDIVKVADDFASGSGKGVEKTKSKRAKGKEIPPKKKHHRSKAREIPRVILREKVESLQSQTKKMERVQKRGIPSKTGGEEHRQRWKEKHGKKVV